jgi:hypothetical protein
MSPHRPSYPRADGGHARPSAVGPAPSNVPESAGKLPGLPPGPNGSWFSNRARSRSQSGKRTVNRSWEMAEFEHRSHGWPKARRLVVARRYLPEPESQPTLFTLGRYVYHAWVTDLPLYGLSPTAAAAMERRIRELREDFASPPVPLRRTAAGFRS